MNRHAAIAALSALLLPLTSHAARSVRFGVGATVVASATVSAMVVPDAQGTIRVEASTRHTPVPMLLVDGRLEPLAGGLATLPASHGDRVTILY